MKKIFFVLALLMVLTNGYAQQPPIMVCNATGTSCTPYKNLDTAVIAASSGSYIYISGGSYPINVQINKELHIFGAGHYPDSSNVTGRTQITTAIYLDQGSNNSSFEGLYFVDRIFHYGTGVNDTISNISIIKCNVYRIMHNDAYDMFNNLFLKDCIIRDWFYPYCINSLISNCFFMKDIGSINNSEITNCIISYPLSGCEYVLLKNNIFDSTTATGGGCDGCILNNNITVYNSLYGVAGAIVQTGTITNVSYSNLYVSATVKGFSYSKDFHLKTTSPGHNAGLDGTDVGIYGGSMPYTNGAVPGNPHIFYKNVSGTTNSSGNLPVNIKTRTGN